MSAYFQYAHAQGKELQQLSGLIIYPDSSAIPQDIIMIPCKAQPGENLKQIIDRVLQQQTVDGFFTYFQHIRWTMPKLNEEIANWFYIPAFCDVQQYFVAGPLRISYGELTFDNSSSRLEDEEDKCDIFKLQYEAGEIEINIVAFPKEIGSAKLFKKVNL